MKKLFEKAVRGVSGKEASCLLATHDRAQIETCAQDYKFGDGSKAIARDIKAGVQDLKRGFEGAVRVVTKKEVGASAELLFLTAR
jgi:hypothetical protein